MKLRLILFLYFGYFYTQNIVAQNTTNLVIELSKNNNSKPILLKDYWLVKIWVYKKGLSKSYKGYIDIIDSETIKINDNYFKISSIEKIAIPNLTKKVIGAGILATEIIVTATGFSTISNGASQTFFTPSIIGIVGGLLITTIGFVIDIIGLAVLMNHKQYNLTDDWSLRIKPNI